MPFPGFPKDCVAFLKDLDKNNDKRWFDANKARYEESVQQPALAFVAAMAPRIAQISKHFLAEAKKSGGSLMRIYRDTRFAKDKTPYNTHVSAVFRHEGGKKAPAPGFFFRIAPDQVYVGAGIYHPDGGTLRRIRTAIDENHARWKRARDHQTFRDYYGELGGASLQRPPRGFAADHPLIEDLKRKDICAFRELPTKQIVHADFLDEVETGFKAAKPLMRFLCEALDLEF